MDEVPYPAEDVGIIIAVNIQNWDEIRGYFEKNGEFHLYLSVWSNGNNVMAGFWNRTV